MDAGGFENFVIIGFDVGFIVDFDEDVAIVLIEEPVGGIDDCVADGGFILEHLILTEVEVADDGDHAELVGAIKNTLEAGHEIREQ